MATIIWAFRAASLIIVINKDLLFTFHWKLEKKEGAT